MALFLNFCQKLGFSAISLAPDMLASQSRALKTHIRVKMQKIFGTKNGPFGWSPGPVNLA